MSEGREGGREGREGGREGRSFSVVPPKPQMTAQANGLAAKS